MRWLVVAALAGCYSPALTPDLPCSETNDCPEGQTCDLSSLSCVTEIPPVRRFARLAAGRHHACGIEFDSDDDGGGTMWCWGDNSAGQLAIAGPFSPAPLQIGGDDDWIAVSAADAESMGIRADGSLWVWGEFEFTGELRQLGVGTEWASISAGYLADCALDVEGAMTCGFLGTADLARPGTWKQVAAHDARVCAIDADDRLFCWGQNDEAEIDGDDSTDDVADPFELMPGSRFLDVAAGADHTCAVRDDGAAFCVGSCRFGQLGDGRDPLRECAGTTPITQVLGDGYAQIAAFDYHTCAVRDDGNVLCWGRGDVGQTGSGVERHADPRLALGNGRWIEVVAGDTFTCARDLDGATFCWGANDLGQLGDGNGGHVRVPEQVAAGGQWQTVRAGDRSTCAIERNGSLWCWGRNGRGELGDGSRRQASRPVQIGASVDWTDVSVGRDHACGIRAEQLYCWGAQTESVEGEELLEPTPLGDGDDWREVQAATWTTCGLRGNDDTAELWCWDVGEEPERIGTDTGWSSLTARNGPLVQDWSMCALRDGRAYCLIGATLVPQATAVTDFVQLRSGFQHHCGLRADETAWCWGTNGFGELGTDDVEGATADAVAVENDAGFRSIAAAWGFTCAVEIDSELVCWGRNDRGGLADGTTDDSFLPVNLGGTDWYAVSAGRDHMCALREDDSLWCWGSDDTDQLGRGLGGSTTPVRVVP